MASGGGSGPASILEVASSTNSHGSQFVSLFAMREQENGFIFFLQK